MAISEHETRTGSANTRADEAGLLHDPRWLLVQRILASPGFQRADQLRKILLYTSRQTILHPDESIREYEIACNVLGRRPDFDPGSDNIVRVQVSHLRRKLERFFAVEGIDEQIHLTIPRGSYAASFELMPARIPVAPAVAEAAHPEPAEVQPSIEPRPAPQASTVEPERLVPAPAQRAAPWTRREKVFAAAFALLLLVSIASFFYRGRGSAVALDAGNAAEANPFLRPMIQNRKGVTIVLPDTSLMMIQTLLGQDVSVSDYLNGFPQEELKHITDPALQKAFAYIGDKRNTGYAEVSASNTLTEQFSRSGAAVNLRYARDLHVHDMGDTNVILLGSRRSNPWASLFTDRTNFRLVENPDNHFFYFRNAQPAPGEQPSYVPDYHVQDRKISYADIALVPNLTNSGFVLLICGSDVQATEAAARFMLSRNWPPQVRNLFAGKGPQTFEVFLRASHILSESSDHFDVLAVRSTSH